LVYFNGFILKIAFFTRHTAQEEGDHKFCWDNSFSSYNSKTVFFELLLENENHEEWNWDEEMGLTPEDVYEMKVQDIQVKFCQNINQVILINELLVILGRDEQSSQSVEQSEALARPVAGS
jgi:hypothetical protein